METKKHKSLLEMLDEKVREYNGVSTNKANEGKKSIRHIESTHTTIPIEASSLPSVKA